MAAQVRRITPQQAHERLLSDPEAMLVCAYDDPEKFEQNRLEGAIPLAELEAQADTLPKDRDIIFYCA